MPDIAMGFKNVFQGKRVLLTGHTGFKGAWLALWLHRLGAELHGFALPEARPGAYAGIGVGKLLAGEHLRDLRDFEAYRRAFRAARPDVVFHLAAQPLVRYSYREPLETLQTNFMGTAHVLEALRAADRPTACVVVTSDKCYENRETLEGYRETDPMGGKDVYSMSKGASELLVSSYRRAFGLRVATARAGNVIGGGDYAEDRIIPDCVRALVAGRAVELRNPRSLRPWQHVLEPVSGYLALGAKLLGPEPEAFCEGWNFGPEYGQGLDVQSVVEVFLKAWGTGEWKLAKESEKVLPEAKLLALNIDKARAKLGWVPAWDVERTLRESAAWYKAFEAASRETGSLAGLSIEQLESYVRSAAKASAGWAT